MNTIMKEGRVLNSEALNAQFIVSENNRRTMEQQRIQDEQNRITNENERIEHENQRIRDFQEKIDSLEGTDTTQFHRRLEETESKLEETESKLEETESKLVLNTKKIKSNTLYDAALRDIDVLCDLPNSMESIRNGTLKIAIVDNSISEGANNLLQDVWVERFINKLKINLPNTSISYTNFSLGGRTLVNFLDANYKATLTETNFTLNFSRSWSTEGKSWIDHVKDYNADLTIIGFGMNDILESRSGMNFYVRLTEAINYIKTEDMDVALITTILPTQNREYYPQDIHETLSLARISRELTKTHKYALIDANRLWRILLYGADECQFNNKKITSIESINDELSYNFNITFNFSNPTYPQYSNECDFVFRQYGLNLLLLRFYSDGTNNYINLHSIGESFGDFLYQWSGSQVVNLQVDGSNISINNQCYKCYEHLYNGALNLSKMSSYLHSVNFNNRVHFFESPNFEEIDLLGEYVGLVNDGINGNGINHPTALGHYLSYYLATNSIVKSLSTHNNTTPRSVLDLNSINPNIISTVVCPSGYHISKPNAQNLIVETIPMGASGVSLQKATDCDSNSTEPFLYTRKYINGRYEANWTTRS